MNPSNTALKLALAGLVALAIAQGVGRFAFTPLLPIMQADAGLGLAQGGWLASVNYLGYMLGALAASFIRWKTLTLLRVGLAFVIITTALMGLTHFFPVWLVWRFIAGFTSAFVLVGTTALCLGKLARQGKSNLAGVVFAGVGVGMTLAGLLCLGLGLAGVPSQAIWLVLAVVSLLALPLTAALGKDNPPSPAPATQAGPGTSGPPQRGPTRVLIACYALFGIGYILPATFLPAQARQLIDNPALFGLAWPVFGITAAVSTLLVGPLTRKYSRRHIWSVSQLIMAVGVALPALYHSLLSIIIASICVGGTFMVISMAGMQEAQAVDPANPQRLIGQLTTAFGLGQLVAPVLFSLGNSLLGIGLNHALLAATAALLISSLWLVLTRSSSAESAS
ncbi:MAG: YbfB/YjiJ family MFS transporter [Burkholderiaceae bacterium]|jgi:MFS family permease